MLVLVQAVALARARHLALGLGLGPVVAAFAAVVEGVGVGVGGPAAAATATAGAAVEAEHKGYQARSMHGILGIGQGGWPCSISRQALRNPNPGSSTQLAGLAAAGDHRCVAHPGMADRET